MLLTACKKGYLMNGLIFFRWMEFARMADNMKELSSNMLMQSKTNTRKAAIRADLDEEIAD